MRVRGSTGALWGCVGIGEPWGGGSLWGGHVGVHRGHWGGDYYREAIWGWGSLGGGDRGDGRSMGGIGGVPRCGGVTRWGSFGSLWGRPRSPAAPRTAHEAVSPAPSPAHTKPRPLF